MHRARRRAFKRARRVSLLEGKLLEGKLHIGSRLMIRIAVILWIHLLAVSVEKKGKNPYKKMVKPPRCLLLLLRGC